jgi:LmbE family N-acetylglucosaminyl deacetylase
MVLRKQIARLVIVFSIVASLDLHLSANTTAPDCKQAVTMFLALPEKRTFTALSELGEVPCWAIIGATNPNLNRLNRWVEQGNPWAAQYLAEQLKRLDGGNLEDALVALGQFSDYDMERLLAFANKSLLSKHELSDALTMLPLSLSDDTHAQLVLLKGRRNKVVHVTRKDLFKERSKALVPIDGFISEIRYRDIRVKGDKLPTGCRYWRQGDGMCISGYMGDRITELTGRVLVLVAHADDESVGYGALLQKMREAVVVIATDGAPQDRYFWERFGSREAYAAVRRGEARQAMRQAGVRELVLLAEEDQRLEDQRLFLNLAAAYWLLEKLVERVRPEAIATLAYEGGHPDHDSCSLLGMRLGEQFGVPVWEAPLYSSAYGKGEMRLQRFICETDDEVTVAIDAGELEGKRAMCAQYASQGDFLQTCDARREVVRRQVKYTSALPPHEGRTNYEQWQWWMSAQEVSAKFAEFLESGS